MRRKRTDGITNMLVGAGVVAGLLFFSLPAFSLALDWRWWVDIIAFSPWICVLILTARGIARNLGKK